jgi:hypothetical protein
MLARREKSLFTLACRFGFAPAAAGLFVQNACYILLFVLASLVAVRSPRDIARPAPIARQFA